MASNLALADSQGDRPSHASVSMPSSYHDALNDPAHMSTPNNIGLESNDIMQVVNAILPESGPLPNQTQHPSRLAPNAPPTAPRRPKQLQPPNIAEVPHTSPADYENHLWMTYSVHKYHSVQLGLPTFTSYGATTLANTGLPDSEMREFNSCCHTFPHVPQ
jgi:cell envelope opacity-associated protein A